MSGEKSFSNSTSRESGELLLSLASEFLFLDYPFHILIGPGESVLK
jgi:hypothetical protein